VLKKDNRYFYQVQCEILSTKADFCDLVIGTTVDMKIYCSRKTTNTFTKCSARFSRQRQNLMRLCTVQKKKLIGGVMTLNPIVVRSINLV